MKTQLILSLWLITISVSCTQKQEENTSLQQVMTTTSSPIYTEMEFQYDPAQKRYPGQYWVLMNSYSQKVLHLTKFLDLAKVPKGKFYFQFDDSSFVKCSIQYAPSCGVGMTIIDTAAWNEHDSEVELFIACSGIDISSFEYHDTFQKVKVDENHIKLVKQ